MCQRLTDRELQIFRVALDFHRQLSMAKGWLEYEETLVREVADKLGFEVSEEDVKILCGPMMIGGVDKQNP